MGDWKAGMVVQPVGKSEKALQRKDRIRGLENPAPNRPIRSIKEEIAKNQQSSLRKRRRKDKRTDCSNVEEFPVES
jgi:hypothetical protein